MSKRVVKALLSATVCGLMLSPSVKAENSTVREISKETQSVVVKQQKMMSVSDLIADSAVPQVVKAYFQALKNKGSTINDSLQISIRYTSDNIQNFSATSGFQTLPLNPSIGDSVIIKTQVVENGMDYEMVYKLELEWVFKVTPDGEMWVSVKTTKTFVGFDDRYTAPE